MRARWLIQTGADRAIVIFGGWAVGARPFAHLTGGQDVLFVDDYSALDADLPDLSVYGHVSLLAWSFGVASYAHWQVGRVDPFAQKVAVNGTLHPVSRSKGIPPVAMRKTAETLSPSAFALFQRRVFGKVMPEMPIDVPARRAELDAIETRGDAPRTAFDKCLISTQDKIFPPANQARVWEGLPVQQIDAPHAPFDQFQTWEALLS
ncbi:hypothetical protein ATO10_08102 [Actibacterium atlanticum]|uniref:Biotin synthesis protein BioC n=1 Tax=Actibacterium atlanticum TaxID=1461693 RepID=A0A058ZMB7_9RHOB|nr:pimeloyl-ACP methyl esterase BioG family protein [Actibacterium atlanticum]KCV82337.1 hypothetical protein ATO10_08102 [Actibacterium atlanticum]